MGHKSSSKTSKTNVLKSKKKLPSHEEEEEPAVQQEEDGEEEQEEYQPPPKKKSKGKKQKKPSKPVKEPIENPELSPVKETPAKIQEKMPTREELNVTYVKEPIVTENKESKAAPVKVENVVTPKEDVVPQKEEIMLLNKSANVSGHVKEAAAEAAACVKECTKNCTADKNATVTTIVKCLGECKCDKVKTEHLMQSNMTN